MTNLAPAPTRGSGHAPASPPARRLTRRRWRDSRLLVGVLLVLISVVVGARVFAVAGKSQSWVAARRTLPAGHVVLRDDLQAVTAKLAPGTARLYYPAARINDLVGGTVGRQVAPGELVAGADFVQGRASPTRLVPVIVKAGHAPALSAGDHLDIYVLQTGTGTAGSAAPGAAGSEVLVLHDVEYIGEDDLSNGDRSLTLRVPVPVAINAVAASQSGRVDVVRLDGGGPAGPTSAPGYGS